MIDLSGKNDTEMIDVNTTTRRTAEKWVEAKKSLGHKQIETTRVPKAEIPTRNTFQNAG